MKLTIFIATVLALTAPLAANAQRITCNRDNNVITCPGYGSFNYRNDDNFDDNDNFNGNVNGNYRRAINELYLQVLGRRADREGLITYSRSLNNGEPISKIRRELAYSGEAEQAISNLYREVSRRNIDNNSLQSYKRMLATGRSLNDLRNEIAGNRGGNRYPGNSNNLYGVINDLYIQILGRNVDPDGLNAYSRELNNGVSVSKIRNDLAYSPEATQAINKLYQEVLRRNADAAGLSTYRNFLATGRSLNDVRRELANSPEARGR